MRERKEEKVMPENQASGRTRIDNLAEVLRYMLILSANG
jgi:hypothetical protein